MSLDKLQFLSATAIQGYQPAAKKAGENYAHEASAWEGVPNTTPQVVGFSTDEQMELAMKVIEQYQTTGQINPFNIGGTQATAKTSAWEGFTVPAKTGNGELPPPDMTGSGIGDKFDSERWLAQL